MSSGYGEGGWNLQTRPTIPNELSSIQRSKGLIRGVVELDACHPKSVCVSPHMSFTVLAHTTIKIWVICNSHLISPEELLDHFVNTNLVFPTPGCGLQVLRGNQVLRYFYKVYFCSNFFCQYGVVNLI